MGLRINTNVASLSAQNKLQQTTKKLTGALERLSTGLRINKGSDDVVGLLKSESLRSQIRGIGVAQLNLSNGSNILGVAEGGLAQLTDIAQQLREKVVQASDDTISTSDRTNISTATTDLLSEFNRLALANEFDGVKLLAGNFISKLFQVGPKAGDTLSMSISDTKSSAVGRIAILTSLTITAQTGTLATQLFAAPDSIVINGATLGSTSFSSDGVSTVEASESAIAYVNAINSISGQSGVTALVNQNVVTLLTYESANDLGSQDILAINGVTIFHSAAISASASGNTTLINAINTVSSATGVTATQVSSSSAIVLTATDGRNIAVRLNISTGSVSGGVVGFGTGTAMLSTSAYSLYRGTFKLVKDDAFVLTGATDEISTTTSVSVGTGFALNTLNVATSTNATDGIFILDNVIRQLQTRRADVGSKSIRFELASAELATRNENLSAAESRIRDADVAVETAALTSQQILQQAGVTVLARANAIPQIALSLLESR